MRYLTLILLLWSSLNAQNREALLIGNSHYQFISNLNDTATNLSSLESALKGLDFNVIIKNDLNSKKLKQAIDEFKERLARSHETIGFLYYSGHGCQLDNVGYLVPTNVNTKKKLDIKYDAINIDKMLETLDSAGNRVNMLFLDACRDVPTNAKGSTKGLGQAPQRPKGTLLVYATEAGKTAEDNSKFINALISNINKPNKNIRDIAYDISNEVADQTGEGQIPEVFAKRLPEVVLKNIKLRVISAPITKPSIPVVTPAPLSNSMKGIVKIGDLMYQNEPFIQEYTWQGAKKYCRALSFGGYSDWRLPTIAELNKISNIKMYGEHDSDWNDWYNKNKYRKLKGLKGKEQFVRKEFLEHMPRRSYFWTSEEDSSDAWIVDFYDGYNMWSRKTVSTCTLCVR